MRSRHLALAAAGCVLAWLARPPRRRIEPLPVTAPGPPEPVDGFGSIELAWTTRGGERRRAPVLLASTTDQVAQGLAGRRDLAGHAGMLFWLPGPTDMPFHMVNTPLPLTLVWFDQQGRCLGSVDMTPGGPDDVALYPPPEVFRYALEVPRGTDRPLGLGPGAQLDLDQLRTRAS